MFFSSIEIRNFKSIGNRGIKIDFEQDRNLYTLIGANNSGKSNVIDALALVLGVRSGKFYNYDFTSNDFYNNDTSKELSIRLTLHNPIKYKNVYRQILEIEGFSFLARPYKKGGKKGGIHSTHVCFGKDGKGNPEEVLMDRFGKRLMPIPPRQIELLNNVHFLDIRNLEGFFSRVTGYGILGRLFQFYRDDFASEKSIYSYKDPKTGEVLSLPSKNAYIKFSHRLTKILRTSKLEEIEDKLTTNIEKFLGIESAGQTINLGIPDHEDLISRLISLKVQEDPKLEARDIGDLGTGYLSLLRLAAIQTLSDFSNKNLGLILVEEPEIYLHPHLRRFFKNVLNDLAKARTNIFYTTHSEEFVDINEYQAIVRVEKPGTLTKCFQVPPSTILDFDRMHIKVQAKGNDELLFARHVLLTEGQDDKFVFELLIEKNGVDTNARSISVIDCGSKTQIPDYVALCQALGINYYVIFDTDKGNAQSIIKTKKILAALGNRKSLYSALPDTLEVALKTSKQKTENWRHLLARLYPLNISQIRKNFPDLHAAIQPFLKIAEM